MWEDKLVVTSAENFGAERIVTCLNARDGKTLWAQRIECKFPETASAITGHAASTPATDGQRVVAFFGNAGVFCYTLDGKKLWERSLGSFETELGLASSVVMDDGRVILLCDHDGSPPTSFHSYLIALDAKDGAVIWKTERPKLFRSWSTPLIIPAASGGNRRIIVNAQDELRSYDCSNGQLLSWVSGMTGWVTPSPVFGHGRIFAASGKNGPVMAVRPDGQGDVTQTHVTWKKEGAGPYVCSPVLYRGCLYVIDEKGTFTCYDDLTGKIEYTRELDGQFTTSPVAGDGKIYVTNDQGTTFVIAAGRNFAELARNSLDELSLASIAISSRHLFIRTEKQLFCIGN